RGKIFIDVDTIQKGRDFTEVLEDHLARCGIMLVLIGDKWLNSTDLNGSRRLDDPNDLVRREISAALARGITVIPVLLDGASMPESGQLPDDLKPLARHQSFSLNHEYFSREIEDLRLRIRRDLKAHLANKKALGVNVVYYFLLLLALGAMTATFLPVREWMEALIYAR